MVKLEKIHLQLAIREEVTKNNQTVQPLLRRHNITYILLLLLYNIVLYCVFLLQQPGTKTH